ncbi:DNA polymerase epsilon subunit 3 [Coccinella septempunctata]|uniref:DNA polymerase epsilon subunit 3 n=1 Tax=Coccinella septempunctata TaxID=41139 RepID=UPI001D064697|nr:DNA polymerase epsilon subunit 3 [Coccinella septempunctata]
MAEKLEDLNLPNASVQKIIKEALPESINVGKDAKAALSRAASVFILYVTSEASKGAHKDGRKTLLGQDVLKAIEKLEFDEFMETLQEAQKSFMDGRKGKGPKKKNVTAEDSERIDEIEESGEENAEEDALE